MFKVFVGRNKDLYELLKDLEIDRKTITLLIGESGIGKSSLLNEYHKEVKQRYKKTHFIGYYDNTISLIAEGSYYLYPFENCLISLIASIKKNQTNLEQNKNFSKRFAESLRSSAKETGKEFIIAIAEDLIKNAGLEKTASVAKKFYDHFKKTKSSTSVADSFLLEQRQDVFNLYLKIFKTISDEFPKRQFLLIFDQFEYVGKASLDFLLNLIKLLPDTFHFLIAFKTPDRQWENESIRKLYSETCDKIIYDLKGKVLQLEGLTAEEIGEWIYRVRKIKLPLIPDLTRIREKSAGLPIILEKWIEKSNNLDYNEIEEGDYCKQIIKLQNALNDPDKIRIRKMSILLYTTDYDFLTNYLELQRKEELDLFLERIISIEIFDQSKQWFKHELLQKCFEMILNDDLKIEYYESASNLIHKLYFTNEISYYNEEQYQLDLHYSYYLHNSKNYEKSFYQNKRTAHNGKILGDLDQAERCYIRAIKDGYKAKIPKYEINDCIYSLSRSIYIVWGRYDEALSKLNNLENSYSSNPNFKIKLCETLESLGIVYEKKGMYDKAHDKYNNALQIAKEIDNNQQLIGSILINQAIIYDLQTNYDAALKNYDEALRIFKALGGQHEIVTILLNKVVIYGINKRYGDAIELLNEAQIIAERLKDNYKLATIYSHLGNILSLNGKPSDAIILFEKALQTVTMLGNLKHMAELLNNLGMAYYRIQKFDISLKKFNEALAIFTQLGNNELIHQIKYKIEFVNKFSNTNKSL